MRAGARLWVVLALAVLCRVQARAEDGSAAWLRYAPISKASAYADLPSLIVTTGDSAQERNAAMELRDGLSRMLSRSFAVVDAAHAGTRRGLLLQVDAIPASGDWGLDLAESYRVSHRAGAWAIHARSPTAILYGAFYLLQRVGAEEPVPVLVRQTPAAAVRWTDEWDNLSGTIERGYAGRSIFFDGGHVRADLSRTSAYARLLASVGINGCNVNNVNADLDVLTTAHLKEFARLGEAFRPWGVKLALSVDLTSPQTVGGLATFDPLDPAVAAWWRQKVDEIYRLIPEFGGFTIKADSEGRKGPSQYGRSPADAANVLARALSPHGGVVLYRGFVYNNHLDWRDPKADRARAGVDNFTKYDGQFEPNVIIQIKEGPIDFQAREPVSPLLAALPHTNVALELQVSQEYTGQQRHMVWLPSMWKWVLDTDMHAGHDGGSTPVREIVTGRAFPLADGKPRAGGFVAVTNVGLEANWLHHPMAMANLYGFGRLAWNPEEPLEGIIDEWTRLTWGNDAEVASTVDALQLASWRMYEGYTGPNGMGTLTNILGYHFGPGIESAERNGWGQWFRGDREGVGMDRTAEGTGYIQQYPPLLAAQYESPATCPDDLLLFFHHVPYTYRLHSGKTLIQSVYDTHYASALEAAEQVPRWIKLQGKVDDERYRQVLALFRFQAGHALVWRDAINTWFHAISGVDDAGGRVGRDANRIEAEAMESEGFTPVNVVPAETASGGKAMECEVAAGCTLRVRLERPAGEYNIAVQYYDIWRGESRYELQVNGRRVAAWTAGDTLPPVQFDPKPDGQDATRYTATRVALKPGDVLTLHAMPDLSAELDDARPVAAAAGALVPEAQERHDYREPAYVDYLELGPGGDVTPQE